MKTISFIALFLTNLALALPPHLAVVARKNAGGGAPPGDLAAIKTSMLAWYDFADATDSHGSYDWTPSGTPTYSGGYVTIIDGVDELNGGTGVGTLSEDFGHPASVDANASYAFWYETNSTTANGEYMMTGHTARASVQHLSSSVGFRGNINSSTQDNANSGVPGDNVWYFIVVTRDAATGSCECWVNGSSDGATVAAYSQFSTEFFIQGDGRFAWMGFWNKKLTSTEIAALYALGKDADYSDLP